MWRQGRTFKYTQDSPAAGQEWKFVVPSASEGALWRPVGIIFRLVTSAVVANRVILIAFASEAFSYALFLAAAAAQTAGRTDLYTMNLFTSGRNDVTPAGGPFIHQSVLPDLRMVEPGNIIRSQTAGLDVGDQYDSVSLLLEEWVYVPPVDLITGAVDDAVERIVAVMSAGKGCGCAFASQDKVGAPTPTPGMPASPAGAMV